MTAIKITPAVAKQVSIEAAKLAGMPAHIDPSLRPVVIVAREGRCRPFVAVRYHSGAVGEAVHVDGYDAAIIAAVRSEHLLCRQTDAPHPVRWSGPFDVSDVLGAAEASQPVKRFALDAERFLRWDRCGEFAFSHGLTVKIFDRGQE